MLSYKVLGLVRFLMAFSLGYLIAELLVKKLGNERDVRFLKYARIVLFVLSVCALLWLLLNKELFHWNYDIATGAPVDHYSTYGRCVAYTIVALISNVVSRIVSKKEKK